MNSSIEIGRRGQHQSQNRRLNPTIEDSLDTENPFGLKNTAIDPNLFESQRETGQYLALVGKLDSLYGPNKSKYLTNEQLTGEDAWQALLSEDCLRSCPASYVPTEDEKPLVNGSYRMVDGKLVS